MLLFYKFEFESSDKPEKEMLENGLLNKGIGVIIKEF